MTYSNHINMTIIIYPQPTGVNLRCSSSSEALGGGGLVLESQPIVASMLGNAAKRGLYDGRCTDGRYDVILISGAYGVGTNNIFGDSH